MHTEPQGPWLREAATMDCPGCGHVVDADWTVCEWCDFSLDSEPGEAKDDTPPGRASRTAAPPVHLPVQPAYPTFLLAQPLRPAEPLAPPPQTVVAPDQPGPAGVTPVQIGVPTSMATPTTLASALLGHPISAQLALDQLALGPDLSSPLPLPSPGLPALPALALPSSATPVLPVTLAVHPSEGDVGVVPLPATGLPSGVTSVNPEVPTAPSLISVTPVGTSPAPVVAPSMTSVLPAVLRSPQVTGMPAYDAPSPIRTPYPVALLHHGDPVVSASGTAATELPGPPELPGLPILNTPIATPGQPVVTTPVLSIPVGTPVTPAAPALSRMLTALLREQIATQLTQLADLLPVLAQPVTPSTTVGPTPAPVVAPPAAPEAVVRRVGVHTAVARPPIWPTSSSGRVTGPGG